MADTFLDSLDDLTGKVAIVTGGGATIGLETTILLARRGCTVYVASRNQKKATSAIDAASASLPAGARDRIIFHHLDLSSVSGALESAHAFLSNEDARLDILVGNAAVMSLAYTLGPDGVESTFATNVLGHYVFVTALLPLLKKAENANIVLVNSRAYTSTPEIDYEDLRREKGDDGRSIMDIKRGFYRYSLSKLALLYFTLELDKRLRSQGVTSVKVNACHPGVVASTALGSDTLSLTSRYIIEPVTRTIVGLLGNTALDAARTQVFLAAGKEISERDVHGEFWVPVFSWFSGYCGCKAIGLTTTGKDEKEWGRLWAFCEETVREKSKS
ncbi:MAG: hypothetical protein M1839_007753 [Geoglossum umbratile]|nr:MAG: hypothetical protein M1839_007753 [Geoglossum umbratile]